MGSKKSTYRNRLFRTLLLLDQSLMTKLTVFSIILVVVPMMMAGMISYRVSSQTLEDEARHSNWKIIEQVKIYVEDYFRDFEISALKIVNHPDTVAFLKMKTYQEVVDANIVPSVRDVLKNSAYSQSDVMNITLILDGVQSINSAVESNVSTVQGIEDEYWYEHLPVMGRPQVYSRIISLSGKDEPVISIVKRIANPNTLQSFGMLVIDLNYKRLHDVARKINLGDKGQEYLTILNDQGFIVYDPKSNLIGKKADTAIIRLMDQGESGSFVTNADGVQTLITYSSIDSLNWKVMTSTPYDALMRSSRKDIARMIFWTSALLIGAALVMSITFAASLVRPLRKLYHYMRRIEKGDFKVRLPVETSDEIGMLSNGFNMMVDRLSQLVEEVYLSKLKETEMALRQRETELKMLQAQINPHFLYNSLDTIRGMALEHGIEEIGSMAAALARLLRYNVKGSGIRVTLQEEVSIIHIYMLLQQFRFEDRLQFDIDVPEWALKLSTIKFTLQPIVENCIVHGIERSAGQCRIRLSAELLPDTGLFQVMVTDNGPGIARRTLEELHRHLAANDALGDHSHIGIMNVHRRIRHIFGEGCGLSIDSVEGQWTEVRVTLPYKP